jgi:hypothetical protein
MDSSHPSQHSVALKYYQAQKRLTAQNIHPQMQIPA